jgi:hypothetical protein
MKDQRNLHLKMQEMCDCYAESDPLGEMSKVPIEQDKEQAALKWLALAALHGINDNAEKISITRNEDNSVDVSAVYRKTNLPNPGDDIGRRIIEDLHGITHMEEGKIPLSIGIRGNSIDLEIKVKKKDGKEKVSIKFPQSE